MTKGFASTYRFAILVITVLLLFGGVATRLVFLQVIDRNKRLGDIDTARHKFDIEKGRRGEILDSHGDTLAISRAQVKVSIDPYALNPKDAEKMPELARLLGIPYAELLDRCVQRTRERKPPRIAATAATDGSTDADNDDQEPVAGAPNLVKIRYVPLVAAIDEEVYAKIEKLKIKGLVAERSYRRTYPHNQLAAHVIGFVNTQEVAAAGIESYADRFLSGIDGWRESEKDARQQELARFRSREVPASKGYTITLSIDSVVQLWAEEELADIAKKFSPKNATIIISDAQTGFILALANYPTFNLNEYNKTPMEVMKNYAITDQIDPGSTFKIVAASAALNERLVAPDTRFDCSSETTEYKGKTLRLIPDDHHWDHPLTVSEIISHSSNRGAALLAMRLGDDRFYEYARRFGFGSKTGFPFGGEITGDFKPPAKWSGIDITRIPAGYSISATPMQIHCAMAAIANGGELLAPQVIKEIHNDSGDFSYTFSKQIVRRVISPETAQIMRALLRGVVSPDGTAGKIFMPGYQFAGKTGTAQKYMTELDPFTGKPVRGYYSRTNHVGSFSGFFPASKPRVVITVIVDDGKTPTGSAAYGATVAAPSFKRVAEKLIPYLNIEPIPDTATPAPAFMRQTAIAANRP